MHEFEKKGKYRRPNFEIGFYVFFSELEDGGLCFKRTTPSFIPSRLKHEDVIANDWVKIRDVDSPSPLL